jgi:hypothetical protein
MADLGTQFVDLTSCMVDIGNEVCPIVDRITEAKEQLYSAPKTKYRLFSNPRNASIRMYSKIRDEMEENVSKLKPDAEAVIRSYFKKDPTALHIPTIEAEKPAGVETELEVMSKEFFNAFNAKLSPTSGNFMGFRHYNSFTAEFKDSGYRTPLINVHVDRDFTYSGERTDYLKGVSDIRGMGDTCVAAVEFLPEIKELPSLSSMIAETIHKKNSWAFGINFTRGINRNYSPDGSVSDENTKAPHISASLDASIKGEMGINYNVDATYTLRLPTTSDSPRKFVKFSFPEDERKLLKEVINRLAPIN